MASKKIKRPILRYHGGKWLLAPWIISHFPKHRIYTEVFGGGGSVLMRKKRSYAEIYNDKWDVIVNVFRVLRDPDLSIELQQRLYLMPFSKTEFRKSQNINFQDISDPVEKAMRTIYLSFAGFGSGATNTNHKTGFRANSNRSGTTPAHDWANYPKKIVEFTERLRGVVIENRCANEVLRMNDGLKTLHYVDPPYVHKTRNLSSKGGIYAFEMDDKEHIELSEVLMELKGMVVLSGYKSDLYDHLYKDWACIQRQALADGARKRTECLWLNPMAQKGQVQKELDFNNSCQK